MNEIRSILVNYKANNYEELYTKCVRQFQENACKYVISS